MDAAKGTGALARKLNISYDQYEFLMEGHPKLRPVETNTGGVYLAGTLFIDLVMRQMGGEGFQQMSQLAGNPGSVAPEQAQAMLNQAMPAILAGLLLLTPLVMATWFAPALILFDGYSAGNGMWWSLWACAVNWRPLLTYSAALGLIGIAALLIPFGLGLLVFLPWVLGSTYAAYRAIFQPIATTP